MRFIIRKQVKGKFYGSKLFFGGWIRIQFFSRSLDSNRIFPDSWIRLLSTIVSGLGSSPNGSATQGNMQWYTEGLTR